MLTERGTEPFPMGTNGVVVVEVRVTGVVMSAIVSATMVDESQTYISPITHTLSKIQPQIIILERKLKASIKCACM